MSAVGKTVGKSGQISLGKSLAGSEFIVETLPAEHIFLKRAGIIPANERWLHTPEMREKMARAEAWMRDHPLLENNLEELESQPFGE